jgi:hypothetical protein
LASLLRASFFSASIINNAPRNGPHNNDHQTP